MSFEIALSGLRAVNEQLDQISNNVANVDTDGFKSSRANFAAAYAGLQPAGVQVSSVTQSIDVSKGFTTTGQALDAAIQGKGFFVMRDTNGATTYTRVGNFQTDKDGYLVDDAQRRVQGYAGTTTGALGAFGDIQINTAQRPAQATSSLAYAGNLSAEWTPPSVAFDVNNPNVPNSYNSVVPTTVYDSLGRKQVVSQYFVQQGPNITDVKVYVYSDSGLKPAQEFLTLKFDNTGVLTTTPTKLLEFTPGGADKLQITFDYTGTTRQSGQATTTKNNPNGYPAGAFAGLRIEATGELTATYSEGPTQTAAVIALANFPAPEALIPISKTSWVSSIQSGLPLIGKPGSGLAGSLVGGALETSNVDLGAELVSLMTAQRNYQGNTKVISTEDQVMQALMQVI